MRVFLVFYFLCFSLLSTGTFADWPLYRGNARADGCATKSVTLPETLVPLWEHRLDTGFFQASPIIVRETVYIGSSDDGMLAFDLNDGKLRWKYPLEYGVLAPAAYHRHPSGQESILFGDTEGVLHAIDATTGTLRWKFATLGSIDNSPNVDAQTNRVLVGSQDGSLYSLNISDGQLAWQYKADDQIRSFPASVNRRCFIAGCDGKLHIVDMDTGKPIAQVDIEAPTGSTPAIAGDRVYFGTEGNEFLAIDWQKAEIVWRYDAKQAFRAPAAVSEGLVIFGGFDRTVRALDATGGEERWIFRTKGRIEHSGPTVVGDRLYVPCSDSFLYVLDLQSGKKLQEIELPGKLLACAAVVDGHLVLGTDDGVLCCLGEKK